MQVRSKASGSKLLARYVLRPSVASSMRYSHTPPLPKPLKAHHVLEAAGGAQCARDHLGQGGATWVEGAETAEAQSGATLCVHEPVEAAPQRT